MSLFPPLAPVKNPVIGLHYYVCSVGPDQANSIEDVIQNKQGDRWELDDLQTLLKVELKDSH